jgi:HD-like signal output (HDOD) protein
MKAPEIAAALTRRTDLPITPTRVKKLRACCERFGVDLGEVLTLVSAEMRAQIEAAS